MEEESSVTSPRSGPRKDLSQMRIYRACIYCRQRKTRCHLDHNKPPCQRCVRENRECVLATSSRGRPKKSRPAQGSGSRAAAQQDRSSDETQEEDDSAFRLQNPSDALGILQVADNETGQARALSKTQHRPLTQSVAASYVISPQGPSSYQLCTEGFLSIDRVIDLIQRYHHLYHPYYPIIPIQIFDLARIEDTLRRPHILTAILLVATKDLEEDAFLHNACSEYMQRLIASLSIGTKAFGEVLDPIEALLILAEWVPQQQNAVLSSVGRGEEDRAAWMFVGTALRIAYFEELDLTSFRVAGEPSDERFLRKRFIWTACYMSDRQISTRVGRAFWSRGPGPWTSLTRADFIMLQPKSPGDEDYASIFQAQLELTQIFTNVHDILYSRRGASLKTVLQSDYVKYIDDFRMSIKGWHSVWGTLTCSPNIKATLLMSYDYLRLYTNAFALQAAFSRKHFSRNRAVTRPTLHTNISMNPDARFVFEALDSAKSLLVTVNNFLDPEQALRYMPLKFFLYIIFSAVFLYKSRFLLAGNSDEARGVQNMVDATINRLRLASSGPQHPGTRYASLLSRLWQKGDSRTTPPRQASSTRPNSDVSEHASQGMNSATDALQQRSLTATNTTTSSFETQGLPYPLDPQQHTAVMPPTFDFNWLDLDAVGEFAIHNEGLNFPVTDAMWFNFGAEPLATSVSEDELLSTPAYGSMFF